MAKRALAGNVLFGSLAVFFGVLSGACWAADQAMGLVTAPYYGELGPCETPPQQPRICSRTLVDTINL